MLLSIVLPSQHSAAADTVAGLLVILLVALVWKVRKYPHRLTSWEILLALLLCLEHYILPQTSGDFLSYKEWVEGAGFTNAALISNYFEHFEKVYYIIVNFVHNDYFLFRLIVWGSSLLLFCLTANRLKINFSAFIFFLCIYIMPCTSTSRVCLAYAIAYFGFSFLVKPVTRKGSTLFSFIIGVLIIAFSLLFHRSALFFIAVLPLSLLDFNKKTLRILAFVFPVLVVALNTNLYDFVFNYNQTDDSLFDAQTAYAYLDAGKKEFGPGHLVRLALYYITCFTILIFIVKNILNKTYQIWPRHIRAIANATLIIMVFASAFLFVGGNTYKIFQRFISFSIVTQGLLFAYLLSIDFEKKWVKRIIWLMASYVIYDIVYENLYLGCA